MTLIGNRDIEKQELHRMNADNRGFGAKGRPGGEERRIFDNLNRAATG
jgi:hypothetical protein